MNSIRKEIVLVAILILIIPVIFNSNSGDARRIRGENLKLSYYEFFEEDFIERNWENLEKGIEFILPLEYQDMQILMEMRRQANTIVLNLAGEDISGLEGEINNYIDSVLKDKLDDIRLIFFYGENIHPAEPLRETFSILNLTEGGFSLVIKDFIAGGLGDGYTQIHRIERNILTNLYNLILYEVEFMLEPSEGTTLISSIFEGKERFIEQLVNLRDEYQRIYDEMVEDEIDFALFDGGIARTRSDIEKALNCLKYSINLFNHRTLGGIYYRVFYRHYIRPRTIVASDGRLLFRPPEPNPN